MTTLDVDGYGIASAQAQLRSNSRAAIMKVADQLRELYPGAYTSRLVESSDKSGWILYVHIAVKLKPEAPRK